MSKTTLLENKFVSLIIILSMQTQMQTRMTHMVFYFQLSFEKAFDSVDHSLLFGVLEKFSFGPNFIHWIKTLYKDAESCAMNNGHAFHCMDTST